ncbi:D-alanine--D-alanine ligase family protein [Fusibacter bizertensis]|uniref:D-alanine--D-alanine ligase n=1 Tax=Fusibacter bizertensis TaxID=1488331 RepID=A0ABT6NDP1_9FIRM|nr:D-alanine--D-alanine ligase family protein [Fusibacter bizertensis]MDH8678530.1 D-alanine--D-alanine ligase family protein [Fusibacter bizertensis]
MINVGVFFGGTSVEHEVSIISAQQAIAQLLAMDGYKLVPIYISKQNRWYTGDYLLEVEHFKDLKKVLENSTRIQLVKGNRNAYLIEDPIRQFHKALVDHIDLAFPIIHGTGGEDGSLQGLLEHLDIPYVGCNVLSASITMDKIASKLFLQSSGIRVVDGEWFYAHHWLNYQSDIIEDLEKKLPYPMIVKPADIGSSVGIKSAKNRFELIEAIDFARFFSPRILVEKMLVGMREINISVLGDSEKLELSVCEEPISSNDFLTYEDKYVGERSSKGMSAAKRQIPANLTTEMKREIERMAAEAFIALDCAGVTRIDFMIEKETQLAYINEFNTVPGSLSFYLWEATGKSFKEMLKAMIDAAYRGYRRKEALTRSNDINILSTADLKGIKK